MKLVEAIAKRIKELMKEKGMNQYKLSKASAVPESTLSTILNAKIKTVQISTIYDICRGLNIELIDFYNSEIFKSKNLDD